MYPFSLGDLRDSAICLNNYMESVDTKMPWQDLRYIFGQIIYGGHIIDDLDRQTCSSYLQFIMGDGLFNEAELFPFAEGEMESFTCPAVTTYAQYLIHIDEELKELIGDEKNPFQNVFLQECTQMNCLTKEIIGSLNELNQGFAGELTMSDSMESLMNDIVAGLVPASWAKLAWPSRRNLNTWLNDLENRLGQLNGWVQNPEQVPNVVWIAGLINPQSFLTAIMQQAAQLNSWELDKLYIQTDVTKKSVEDIESSNRDGCFITGLYIEGARWNINGGV